MKLIQLFVCVFIICMACNHTLKKYENTEVPKAVAKVKIETTNTAKKIIEISLPDGYVRLQNEKGNFAHFLQNTALKNDATVYYYNGAVKPNQAAQYAVLNISVGSQNLQQCADAVMRLRAEHLYTQKDYSKILFIDNEKQGYQFTAPYDYSNFTKYLNRVFGMCGTASLSKQMKSISHNNVQIGDVLIRGGFPGHAVIVVDMAVNDEGKKIFLIAQSYMPAQDIHILNNPMNTALSPWYELSNEAVVYTPEYTFTNKEWKTW